MSYKKVVFLRYLPLTQKISKDFYFEEISESGIKVEYWDVSFIFAGLSQIEDYNSIFVRRFTSYSEVKSAIKEEDRSNTLFILIMTYNGDLLRLYTILSRYNCTLSVLGKNTFPIPPFSRSSILSSSKLSLKFLRKLLLNKLAVLTKKHHIIKNYDILFLAGNKGKQGIGRVSQEELSSSIIVNINSDDYDCFKELSFKISESENLAEKYAVFLDEYLPLHQDLELTGMKSINARLYYDALNHTFNILEKRYGVKVVIAAHPKAVRYKTENFFEGRDVIWGRTAELCHGCEFVLAHDSTSINYAVLCQKPIISLISDDIIKTSPMISDSIHAFSDYLHTPIVNIDRPINDSLKLEIDNESYTDYKYDFLTSTESERKRTVDIIIDFLHNSK